MLLSTLLLEAIILKKQSKLMKIIALKKS